jgi:hypothetical protein
MALICAAEIRSLSANFDKQSMTSSPVLSATTKVRCAELDSYIGYYEPYALSHEALDRDTAFQAEVENAAMTLCEAVRAGRDGKCIPAGASLVDPRPK